MQRRARFFAVAIVLITLFTTFACSPDSTIALVSSHEPSQETPSPSPTPSSSPTPLPMDVDLGLTDELRKKKIMLASIYFMNVSIGSNEYWVVGYFIPANDQKETDEFVNPYDEQVLVFFYDEDKLISFVTHYKRKDMELGEYKPNSDTLLPSDFKVNKILGIRSYKQEYPSTIKTSIDYMMMNDEAYAVYYLDDITYAQLDEFYRATVAREKWFVPSEQYVKKVENTANETN